MPPEAVPHPGQSRSGQSRSGQSPRARLGPGSDGRSNGRTRISPDFLKWPDCSVPAQRSLHRIFKVFEGVNGEGMVRRCEQNDPESSSPRLRAPACKKLQHNEADRGGSLCARQFLRVLCGKAQVQIPRLATLARNDTPEQRGQSLATLTPAADIAPQILIRASPHHRVSTR
jgi:hypothetical protein